MLQQRLSPWESLALYDELVHCPDDLTGVEKPTFQVRDNFPR